MPVNKVLVCTVGGSHEPIVTALRNGRPDHVIFVCSGKDPATGRPGSEAQILGTGNIIKTRPDDAKLTLPNIPAQAGLPQQQFDVLLVPADDLDAAFAAIYTTLRGLRSRFPDANVIADYTGGTKTMSSALVTAALESGVELQLVTGSRVDLVKVRDGTQQVAVAEVEGVRLKRAMAPFVAAWVRYAYDEAAAGLASVVAPRSNRLRARLNRARDLSAAFAAWDRFDHIEAARLLNSYAPIVAAELGVHLGALKTLAAEPSSRRAAAGRYDDAVARAYRVLEWTAQWILKTRAGLDTADLPAEKTNGLVQPNRDGKYQAGLFAAWQLVALHTGGADAKFFVVQSRGLLDHLLKRNLSILAHGFRPVGREDWDVMRVWLEAHFVPALREEFSAAGQKQLFWQLPNTYLWELG